MNDFKLVKVVENDEFMIFNLVNDKKPLIIYKVKMGKRLDGDAISYTKSSNSVNSMLEVMGLSNLCSMLFLNNISFELRINDNEKDEKIFEECDFIKTDDGYVRFHPEAIDLFKNKLQKECEKTPGMEMEYDKYLEIYSTYVSNITSLSKRK